MHRTVQWLRTHCQEHSPISWGQTNPGTGVVPVPMVGAHGKCPCQCPCRRLRHLQTHHRKTEGKTGISHHSTNSDKFDEPYCIWESGQAENQIRWETNEIGCLYRRNDSRGGGEEERVNGGNREERLEVGNREKGKGTYGSNGCHN